MLLDEFEPVIRPITESTDVSIVVKNLDASWAENCIVRNLHDINVNILQKKIYAVVGPVGSGKVLKLYKIIIVFLKNNIAQ